MADCVLCGESFGPGRKHTKEHVFPKWLEKLFVPEGKEAGVIEYDRRSKQRGTPMQREEWEDIPFNLRVSLCELCNNGWCNEIESEAKPFLIPMICGQPITLDASAQTSVAIWATKTLLMLQTTHKTARPIQPDAFRWFRQHRWPLTNEQLWIGHYNGEGDWPTSYRQYGMSIRKKNTTPESPKHLNAHIAAIGVGHLVFLAFGHTVEDRPSVKIKAGMPAAAALRPIWPALGGSVEFPPPGIVAGNGGLEGMIDAFGDAEDFRNASAAVSLAN